MEVLFQEAVLFSKAAFVTFGGAYAVLKYIADMAVNHYGWLTTQQMVQGLGVAEATPGPLIMVTQNIGFLAAWRFSGKFTSLFFSAVASLLTTYMTFLPCFFSSSSVPLTSRCWQEIDKYGPPSWGSPRQLSGSS